MALFDSSIFAIYGTFHREKLVALGFADCIFNSQIQESAASSLDAAADSEIEEVELEGGYEEELFGGKSVDSLQEEMMSACVLVRTFES